ncbi:MAG TPA: bacteriohemerythrin [Dissulfurispiraceae bacterium]|nr:bacteriohemerythrin [Dissulfurispiraceae bacterium]
MALMAWSDNLSVNVAQIDEQHKKLVGILNDLHDAMKQGKGNDVTGNVLSGLVQYVASHFATEEKLMKTHAYPDYLKHKFEHDALTKQALDLQNQFQEGKSVLTIELMKFLKDWLSKHILGTDKKYGPFLNSKGIV